MHLTAIAYVSVLFFSHLLHDKPLTIEGLDARQVHLPAEVLAVDLTEVGHKEGVLLSGLAVLVVNALHALAEGIANQLLGGRTLMVVVVFT